MNILLLNMPVTFNKWANLEIPLGVAYVASSLLDAGHEVKIKDFEVENFSPETITSYIKEFKPRVIGFSFRTASYRSAVEAIKIIKSIDPDILLVCGGHHATAFSEDVIKETGCDIVVRGEAEETIVELITSIESGDDLQSIAGITYKKDGNILQNRERDLIKDLNLIPFPAWHLLPIEKYSIHSIITSRGCPFSCIYCDKNVSTRKVRSRNALNVYEEIVKIRECYGDKYIYFVDDLFFQNKKRNNELFELIKPLGLKWQCQSRADIITKELVVKAKETGCDTVIFGLESGDPDELEFIRKSSTVEKSRDAVLATKEAGIRVRANFMLGFPISTEQTVINTIKFAESLPIDNCRFFIVTPLPNTELWEYVSTHNLIPQDVDWKSFDLYSLNFDVPAISPQSLVVYACAAYLHVLKNKIIGEITLKNFMELASRSIKTRRIRGNINPIFSSSVNLVFDIWLLLKKEPFLSKFSYLFKIVKFEKKISRS